MITRLIVKNFKSLADVDFELGPLTVLVGPNGSGKSNVLEALGIVFSNSTDEYRGMPSNIDLLHHKMSSPDQEIYVSVQIDSELIIHTSPISVYSGIRVAYVSAENSDGLIEYDGIPDRIGSIVVTFLEIDLPPLRQPTRSLNEDILKPDASNLGGILERLLNNNPQRFEDLKTMLCLAVPGLSDLTVKALGDFRLIELIYDFDGKSYTTDLGMESDGTIRLLALLTLLLQENLPDLIMIEEPEIGLHPGKMAIIADALEAASDRTQVIVTTHSPDLVSEFEPSAIRVVEKIDGATVVAPVAEDQIKTVQQQLFSLGELMVAEGLKLARP